MSGNTSPTPDMTFSGGVQYPLSLVATLSGDIYVDNGVSFSKINKWTINSTNTSYMVMTITEECYSMFVDMTNTLYCAMTFNHRIAKKWLIDNTTTLTVAAGDGGTGTGSTNLYYPAGVFVDLSLNLYVGDCGNDRIQKFALGQMSGTTIAGNGAPGTFTFDCPNAVVLDANGYLFVTDNYNSRLIGSGPYGYRCLFGCIGGGGLSSGQLYTPRQFSFDSYGNFYVADQLNHRIQKFVLASNSCSKNSIR